MVNAVATETIGRTVPLVIWATLELALTLQVLLLALSICLDLRALLWGVSFLVAVAALLVEKERTHDLTFWSFLVFDKVRGVLAVWATCIVTDFAIGGRLPSTLLGSAIMGVTCSEVLRVGHGCSRHDCLLREDFETLNVSFTWSGDAELMIQEKHFNFLVCTIESRSDQK
jgi:hypothetical protein